METGILFIGMQTSSNLIVPFKLINTIRFFSPVRFIGWLIITITMDTNAFQHRSHTKYTMNMRIVRSTTVTHKAHKNACSYSSFGTDFCCVSHFKILMLYFAQLMDCISYHREVAFNVINYGRTIAIIFHCVYTCFPSLLSVET